MTETQSLRKVEQNVRFIQSSVTPSNPKNAFYQNYEETLKWYSAVILAGLIMIFYFVVA